MKPLWEIPTKRNSNITHMIYKSILKLYSPKIGYKAKRVEIYQDRNARVKNWRYRYIKA